MTLHWVSLAVGAAAAAAGGPVQAPRAALRPEGSGQAFVQLFEWSWPDVATECEAWLGPKGFTAVQVSPPTEHITGHEWWTRYQPVSFNLTSRSGDEAAFISMIRRCNAAGVGVYVDAVTNHCAHGSGVGVAGSHYGGRSFPLFGLEDFHHDPAQPSTNCVVQNYSDVHEVQYCDLLGMPDLCTECGHVQEVVASYLRRLADLGVAGIRVDAAKHMDPLALSKILARTGRELHVIQEVIQEMQGPQASTYFALGHVTEFDYGKQLERGMDGRRHFKRLKKFGEALGFMPSGNAVVFVDNHDTQRQQGKWLTHRSPALYTLANVFMLAHPYGYPQLMSSFPFKTFNQGPPGEAVHGFGDQLRCGPQGPWLCEHRWPAIANMVAWRRTAGNASVSLVKMLDGETMVLCRGTLACVVLHRGKEESQALELNLPLVPGAYCNVVQSDAHGCPTVLVGEGGATRLQVPPLGAVALHVGARTSTPSLRTPSSFLRVGSRTELAGATSSRAHRGPPRR